MHECAESLLIHAATTLCMYLNPPNIYTGHKIYTFFILRTGSTDYSLSSNLMVAISSSSTPPRGCVNIQLIDDGILEPSPQTFIVRVSSENAGVGEMSETEVEIINVNRKLSLYTVYVQLLHE